ncbi:MAG TPA: hypothetical protein VGN24_01350 [Rhodanobacter sp.]|jgi:hypothetical protein|nr:hypothetical protein [Rhodanobacter sp.]
MKILTVCVISALALTTAAGALAAEANKAVVNRDWTDTVAPAQQQAYEAGLKAYNQCLHEHGLKYSQVTVTHETGDTYKYSTVTGPYTWADFDAMDVAAKPCDATWRAQSNPHLQSETSVFMVDQPELSHMPTGWEKQAPPAFLDIIYETLKPGHDASEAFTMTVKKIAAAAAKSQWPYYFRVMRVQGGGEGSPDYVLVLPQKNWADYGAEASPSLWKMVEGVYGKDDAAALRKSFNDAVEHQSSHVDRTNMDLSYIAGK